MLCVGTLGKRRFIQSVRAELVEAFDSYRQHFDRLNANGFNLRFPSRAALRQDENSVKCRLYFWLMSNPQFSFSRFAHCISPSVPCLYLLYTLAIFSNHFVGRQQRQSLYTSLRHKNAIERVFVQKGKIIYSNSMFAGDR